MWWIVFADTTTNGAYMFTTAERPDSAPLRRVNRRLGTPVPFDSPRIMRAIVKAGQVTGEFAQCKARAHLTKRHPIVLLVTHFCCSTRQLIGERIPI